MTQVSHRQVQSPTPRLAGVGLWVFLAAALICPAATLQVTTTNDSGAGSLRQAILDANATNGLDTITFKISSPSLFTISPAAALPAITDPVVIDGTTQPGHTTNHPLIELNGVSAGGSSVGLRLLAGNSTVRGLAIGRFGAEGIHVETGGSNFIQGNFIGTDVNGLLGRGNANGIVVNLSSGNVIGGTNPGTSAAGSFALGNGNNGIAVYGVSSPASGNLIGGATTGARNLLSGNNGSGIYLIGSGATGNVVQGNYIGSDAAGHLPVRNAGDGITLQGAANNAIGGTGAGEGNLLSGNTQSGVSFFVGAPSNQVQGNLIGTDASGQLALGNGASGVTLLSSSANVMVYSSPIAPATGWRAT
ncbi:MAG: hypothetical protein DME25_01225 [Verrucomicrobia bacterium]|nr:MAG: hypothetical protein DME25_01225 [Verrucomicrobiota bacterium]